MDLGNTRMFVVSNDWDPGTRRLNGISLDQEGVSGTDLAARYTYDAAGNVKAIDNRPTRSGAPARDTQCFSYDGLGRLTSAWTPSSASCGTAKSVAGLGGPARYWTDYTYDPVGNRTSATEHTAAGDQEASYSYPAAGGVRPHAVSKVTEGAKVSSFVYDASGNTITRTVAGQTAQTLTWDDEGELGKVTQSGKSTASFVYTADGERLIRKQDGATTVYLPGGQELTLTAAGAKKATRYYSWAGQTVAVRTGAGFDDVSTLVNDHHGTASVSVTNVSAKVTRRYQSPFGEARGTAPASWSGDHGFLDKPADSTGLTAIGARYYDPAIGRFVSVDPVMDLADPQQWHGYAYAHSSPVTFSDPTGLREVAGDGRHDTQEQIKSAVNHTKKGGGWTPQFVKPPVSVPSNAGSGSEPQPEPSPAPQAAPTPPTDGGVRSSSEGIPLDEFGHTTLDGLGMVPALGIFPDLINCIWYAGGANWGGAGMSCAAAIPIVGLAVTPVKWGVKGTDAAIDAAKAADDVPTCFVAGTLIRTADGDRPIEQIEAGDKVWAKDLATGRDVLRVVDRTFVRHAQQLVHLTIDGQELTTTVEHPFWADGHGWVDAGDLKSGDILVTPDGVATVDRKLVEQRAETVYNFRVTDLHNYYALAGSSPVLVHNADYGFDISDEAQNIAKHSNARFNDIGGIDHYVRGVDPKALDAYVDGVLDGRVPNVVTRYDLRHGRVAHWDPDKGAVIIEDGAGGSVFTPGEGWAYFEELK